MKILFLFLFISISFNGFGQKTLKVSIDPTPARKFINLMTYYETQNHDYLMNPGKLGKDTLKQLIRRNHQDKVLKERVNSLLSLPVYDELAGMMMAKKRFGLAFGRRAYRYAFQAFPFRTVDMRGGISWYWLCGARTEIQNEQAEDSNFTQEHTCMNPVCRYSFLVVTD